MNFVTSISLVVLGAMFLALLGWGSIRAAWRNCEGRRGVFAALAILAAICSIVAQKPSPDTPTITVDALLRDVGCYATNNVFHAAVTNAPSYAGVDFSDCDLMVYARERASSDAASWFELTPRKKFSQQPADYAIENATNFNYMVYLNYVPPSPVHTNGVFELYGFVIENEAQGEPDRLAAGFINSRAVPLPFDAEVEYLESTGTQWIDTGYVYNEDSKFVCDAMLMSVPSDTFAVMFGAVHSYHGVFLALNNTVPIQARFGANSVGNIVSDLSVQNAVGVRHKYELSARRLAIDDDVFTRSGFTPYTVNRSIWLCSGNDSDSGNLNRRPCSLRVYAFAIYNGNALVRDFIPVRKGTVGAMYDKRGVGGMNPDGSPRNDGMYFNRGTGNFGYGNDK